jgi:hypothetical protein
MDLPTSTDIAGPADDDEGEDTEFRRPTSSVQDIAPVPDSDTNSGDKIVTPQQMLTPDHTPDPRLNYADMDSADTAYPADGPTIIISDFNIINILPEDSKRKKIPARRAAYVTSLS